MKAIIDSSCDLALFSFKCCSLHFWCKQKAAAFRTSSKATFICAVNDQEQEAKSQTGDYLTHEAFTRAGARARGMT